MAKVIARPSLEWLHCRARLKAARCYAARELPCRVLGGDGLEFPMHLRPRDPKINRRHVSLGATYSSAYGRVLQIRNRLGGCLQCFGLS